MKFLLHACAATLICSTVVLAGAPPLPQVVIVGMGAKNPTFNESKFPDLTFVYLPTARTQAKEMNAMAKAALNAAGAVEVFEGEPSQIVTLWNKSGSVSFGDNTQSPFKAVLVDAAGMGGWQGCINPDDPSVSEGEGEEETLEDAFSYFVKKGKQAEAETKKEQDWSDKDAFVGVPFPEFAVTDAAGAEKPVSTFAKSGKPVLFIFTRIPEGVDLTDPAAAMKTAKSAGEAWKAVALQVFKDSVEELFKSIEKEWYGKKIKD